MSVPVVEKLAVRQSSPVRSEPLWYGYTPKVLHISVRKGHQQYDDNAHSSTTTELQQLVYLKAFPPVETFATAGIAEGNYQVIYGL